jgi:hypothetical protein
MKDKSQSVSLGFTKQMFPPGVHVCQVFSEDDERQDSILHFILSGLQAKERTSCFSDKMTDQAIEEFLSHNGVSCQDAKRSGAFALTGAAEVYFKDHRFDPDQMLDLLREFYKESVGQGYTAMRVIGEMSPEVQHLPGGSRLLEYESRVSILLRDCPVTAVCQYDARLFDGAAIMDILKVHPLMVIRGSVVHNPFYIKPEDFLKSIEKHS